MSETQQQMLQRLARERGGVIDRVHVRKEQRKQQRGPEWVTWYNLNSGNQTTRAHAVSTFLEGRTECGWPIPAISNPARTKDQRCQACLKAVNNKQEEKRWQEKT